MRALTKSVYTISKLIGWIWKQFEPPGSEELAYRCMRIPNFHYSPRQFYREVERKLASHRLPAVSSYEQMNEGGILDPRRLYLLVRWEHLLFFICAAPVGSDYFVSARLIEPRRDVNPLRVLLHGFLLAFTTTIISSLFGRLAGALAAVVLLVYIFRNASLVINSFGQWFREILFRIPTVHWIREIGVGPDAFYRRDMARVFQETVHDVLAQSIEEISRRRYTRGNYSAQNLPT